MKKGFPRELWMLNDSSFPNGFFEEPFVEKKLFSSTTLSGARWHVKVHAKWTL